MWALALLIMLLMATGLVAVLGRAASRGLGVSWRETLVWLGIIAEEEEHEAVQLARAERRAREARRAAEAARRAGARGEAGSSASRRTVARRAA